MTPSILLKNPFVLDVETTISNNGNTQDINNKLILIQLHCLNTNETSIFEERDFPTIKEFLKKATLIIGVNLKFDLGWLRKTINYICDKPIWDLQLAEFLFSNQKWSYPSLNGMCTKYEVGHKKENIKEYWDKGINTNQIPINELIEYGIEDCLLTKKVFYKQVEQFETTQKSLYPLFRLSCNDLLVLHEMEYNGLIYDEQNSLLTVQEYETKVKIIDSTLDKLLNIDIKLNYASNDDISIILYGGTKKITTKLPIGEYKTGLKIGQIRYKLSDYFVEFPRLVTPSKGSELKKEGFYSTDSPTLLSLKPNAKTKKIITLLLERSKYLKIIGTYLKGLPSLREKMNWPPNHLYPSYNQCQAVTGRLSSSKPNAQNQTPESKQFFISRFT